MAQYKKEVVQMDLQGYASEPRNTYFFMFKNGQRVFLKRI
jgi:hypothetical protein